jgi:hypothetical protein
MEEEKRLNKMTFYEIRWINPTFKDEIVEKFGSISEAQERVREIREEYGFAPNVWTRCA